MIIEGAKHYIFTMDLYGNMKTANKTLLKEQRLSSKKLMDKNIKDIIFGTEEEKDLTSQIIHDKIIECIKTGKPVIFKTMFKSILGSEPADMHVHFEHIDIEGGNEILVRSYNVIEDSLLKYLDTEEQLFAISNSFSVAEEISHRLVRNINKYMKQKNLNRLRIALREIIVNAIEHGNLDITTKEKKDQIDDNNYYNFVAARKNLPEYRDKLVEIYYALSEEMVEYRIRDMGKGFNHGEQMAKAKEFTLEEKHFEHSTGLNMALYVFSDINFNDRGNEITLTYNFQQQP